MSARASRLEIITRSERRRRYSVADKLHLVAECDAPGGSVAGVAKHHEVSASLLFSWRRQVREGKLSRAIADAEPTDAQLTAPLLPPRASTSDFIQLDALRVEPTTIRAGLPGGLTVDFPVDLDPLRIAAVIRCLREGDRQ
jgi:transposase